MSQASSNDGSARDDSRAVAPRVLFGVAALVVMYVLSIGPVVAACRGNPRALDWVRVVYAPVIWLHEHTFLRRPLDWYADLFGWQ